MSKSTTVIKSAQTGVMKLSPVPIIPAMAFSVSNLTGVDIKLIVDGKKIRLEKGGS